MDVVGMIALGMMAIKACASEMLAQGCATCARALPKSQSTRIAGCHQEDPFQFVHNCVGKLRAWEIDRKGTIPKSA